jgi:hypothetical protein
MFVTRSVRLTRSKGSWIADPSESLAVPSSKRNDVISGHVMPRGARRSGVVTVRTRKRERDRSCVCWPRSRTSSCSCSSSSMPCSVFASMSPAPWFQVLRSRTSRSCGLGRRKARAPLKATNWRARLLRCGRLPGDSRSNTAESKWSHHDSMCRFARHECASKKEEKVSEREGQRKGPME